MSDIIEYKCPACGGAMVFDSKSQHMKCPYCDTEMTIEEFQRTQKSEDIQTDEKKDSEENWRSMSTGEWQNDELSGMRVYSCKSCGSEIVADETTGATTCPFCNNKITVKGQFAGDLKPDYIIPFKLDKKAAKAAAYAREFGTAYVKALSACPLNWNDRPDTERKVIAAAVDCCYFPLYEIERGITSLSYDPKKSHKKIPVTEWFSMMGRTKHLATEEYKSVADQIQAEVDRRYERLAACAEHLLL